MSHTTHNWEDEKKRGHGLVTKLLEGLHSAHQVVHYRQFASELARQMCHQRQLTVCTVPPIKLGVVEQ